MNIESELFEKMKRQSIGKCFFCNPVTESVLWENESVRIIADAFPLIPGHMLLTSKKHYGCLADLPNEEINSIFQMTQNFQGNALMYEHGRVGTCGVNFNACEHFHLNILPTEQSFEPSKQALDFGQVDEFMEYYYDYGEYLLLINGQKWLLPIPSPVPAHYLRTVMGQFLGIPERAEWESLNDGNYFAESYAKAKSFVGSCLLRKFELAG